MRFSCEELTELYRYMSLPNDRILDTIKLKAPVGEKSNVDKTRLPHVKLWKTVGGVGKIRKCWLQDLLKLRICMAIDNQ